MFLTIPAGYPGGGYGNDMGYGYGYGNYGLGLNQYNGGLVVNEAPLSDYSSRTSDDTSVKVLGFGALAIAVGAAIMLRGKGEKGGLFKRLRAAFKRTPKTEKTIKDGVKSAEGVKATEAPKVTVTDKVAEPPKATEAPKTNQAAETSNPVAKTANQKAAQSEPKAKKQSLLKRIGHWITGKSAKFENVNGVVDEVETTKYHTRTLDIATGSMMKRTPVDVDIRTLRVDAEALPKQVKKASSVANVAQAENLASAEAPKQVVKEFKQTVGEFKQVENPSTEKAVSAIKSDNIAQAPTPPLPSIPELLAKKETVEDNLIKSFRNTEVAKSLNNYQIALPEKTLSSINALNAKAAESQLQKLATPSNQTQALALKLKNGKEYVLETNANGEIIALLNAAGKFTDDPQKIKAFIKNHKVNLEELTAKN